MDVSNVVLYDLIYKYTVLNICSVCVLRCILRHLNGFRLNISTKLTS
jgi:hypothetical protein